MFTDEARTSLVQYLNTHELPAGIGNKKSACSIAAINLAISGKLTDDIPDCMSEVLGKATIALQDAMPDDMRNSVRYKALLPNMAGTGRDREQERLDILLEWMWDTALPQMQPVADKHGFGSAWNEMLVKRTADAARAADAAANANAAAYAAYAAGRAAAYAADAARAAASAAYAAADVAYANDDFWQAVDAIGVLERMTYLTTEEVR
jgi:hypothetical protein